MTDEFGIAGKTLLVTGSGRNLGKAIVLEFAARGANVVINTRSNADEASQVKEEAEALGAKAIVVLGDAAYKSTVVDLKVKAEEAFGHVDIYVSNAARRLHKDFWETSRRGLAPLPEPAAHRVVVPGQGVRPGHARARLGPDHAHERPGRLERRARPGCRTRRPRAACGRSPSRWPGRSARTGSR